jgi:hypothetical protein
MGVRLALMAIKIVEFMFFIGLAGCATVVLLSWISVTKGCFTDKT